MSWKACAYVKELREGLIITEKFVLLVLAEYHRTDDKLAWPSVETLAHDCLMTERGIYQILARLEQKDFIRRTKGGGRGVKSGYQIVGVDVKKGEQQTVNTETVFPETVNQTLNGDALNPERNPAPVFSCNKEEPVFEPVKESNGGEPTGLHPLNYAEKLLEMIGMPNVGGNRELLAETIRTEAKFSGRSMAEATRYIAECVRRDRAEGIEINRWYFQEAKYRLGGKINGKSKEEQRQHTNIQAYHDVNRKLEETERRASATSGGIP